MQVVWPDNIFGKFYCSKRHPQRTDVYCRRQLGHPGEHSAFVHSIKYPQYWIDEREQEETHDQ